MLVRFFFSLLVFIGSASSVHTAKNFEFFGLETILIDYIPQSFILDVTIGLVGAAVFVIITMFLKPRKIPIDEVTTQNSPMMAVICQRIAFFAFIYCVFFFLWGLLERQGHL